MARVLALIVLFALSSRVPAADDDPKPSPADDLKALQGVWQSSPDAKRQLKILFLDDKVGYLVADPKAKLGTVPVAFLALSATHQKEEKSQRYFEIEINKDTVERVDYRFEKGGLVIGLKKKEYKVEHVNTRASTSPAARKLVGTWKVASLEFEGKEQPPERIGLAAVVFTEDRYILKDPAGKDLLNSFYRVDGDQKPAALDWYGMKPNYVIPLIYEIEGNVLRLSHPPLQLVAKGAQRPTSFDTKKTGAMLLRAKSSK